MSNPTKPRRLDAAAQCSVSAVGISDGPALPPVSYAAVGQQAPVLLDTPAGALPQADAVVITWAGAEWAALQQVFCGGTQAMPYAQRKTSAWPGWQQLVEGASAGGCGCYGGKDCYWGYYRLVQVAGRSVLLWKSNVHLDESGGTGQPCLEQMMGMLLDQVQPRLVLSLGTAGGSRPEDAIGTVNIVNAATLDMGGDPSTWPTYANAWQPSHAVLGASGFESLLFPTPTTPADLESLAAQFDKTCGTTFSLADLDPGGVDFGQTPPAVNDLTPAGTPLLTTNSFVTGTTSGQYDAYAVIEMDDAVLWSVCQPRNVAFGSVRNVSDPVQNASLPPETQGNWGEILYNTYGFYTSYNGALAAWAILCAEGAGSAS